ncbi:MAG: hypothetical protein M1826_004375 [Phylliscum demangeonii]|nr:MAG: hypothetical protein M1826_004375 [Phylliscum demangeonii]
MARGRLAAVVVCCLAVVGRPVTAQQAEQPVTAQQAEQPKPLNSLLDASQNLTRFRALIEGYPDLDAALSLVPDLTVLAPNDDAFDRLQFSPLNQAFADNDTSAIRDILTYHIFRGVHAKASFNSTALPLASYLEDRALENVTGSQKVMAVEQAGKNVVFISGLGSRASLRRWDMAFSNGLVHIIDSVLHPPQPFSNTSLQFNATSAAGAVIKANLSDYVDTTRDLTVFAPSNIAFQLIGSGLNAMSVEDLGKLMRYHVVPGTVGYTALLPNNTILRSALGTNLTVTVAGNSLYVNSAQIIQQDLLLSNGIMHIIDNVLDYHAPGAFPNPAIPTQPAVLPGTPVTDLPFTSFLPQNAADAAASANSNGNGEGAGDPNNTFGNGSGTDTASATASGADGSGAAAATTTTDSGTATDTAATATNTSTKKSAACRGVSLSGGGRVSVFVVAAATVIAGLVLV